MSDFEIDDFSFTPEDGFLDTTAFPDPATEEATRTQLMSLHNQIKDYMNNTVKTAILAVAAAHGNEDRAQQIKTALEELDTIVGSLPETVESLGSRVSALEGLTTYHQETMAAATWDNGVYSFENTYPSTDCDIEIALDMDEVVDADEVAMWNAANIVGSYSENKVTAYGTVPTGALHIIVKRVDRTA